MTDEDGHDYNPATFVIEKMGLSNKATMTLKQMGFLTFGDFEHADAKALEAQVLIGRKNVQTIDRILEAYGLEPLEYSNTEDEVESEDDEQATEQDTEQDTEQETSVQEEVVQETTVVQEPPVHEEAVQDGEITAEIAETSPETMVEDDGEEDVEVEDDLDEEDIYPEDMPAKTTPEEDFVDLDDDDF